MQIYFTKTTDFDDLLGIDLLTEERRSQVDRYKWHTDKVKCLVSGLLLRYVLGDKAKSVKYLERGKPYLPDENIYFNLAHSGEMVIIAVDEKELGVDIEKIRPVSKRVATRCYTKEEQDWLFDKSDIREFYKLWTAKESVLKAIGSGFSISPLSFSVLPRENGLRKILGEDWYLTWYKFDEYECCLCSKSLSTATPVYVDKDELLK